MEVSVTPKLVHRRRHRRREDIAAILNKFDHSEISGPAFGGREREHAVPHRDRPRGVVLVPVHVAGSADDDVGFEMLLVGSRTLRFPLGVPAHDLVAVGVALKRPCSR